MTRFTWFHSRSTTGRANDVSRIGWMNFYMSFGRRAFLVWIGAHTFMLTYPSRNAMMRAGRLRENRIRHLVAR